MKSKIEKGRKGMSLEGSLCLVSSHQSRGTIEWFKKPCKAVNFAMQKRRNVRAVRKLIKKFLLHYQDISEICLTVWYISK